MFIIYETELWRKSWILICFTPLFAIYPTKRLPIARAMGLVIIILSNLFLVQVNSSECDFAFRSIARLAKDKVTWAVNIGTIVGLIAILYTPISRILKLAPLSAAQFFIAVGIAAVSVLWYEIVKLIRKLLGKKNKDTKSKMDL